MRAKVAKAIRAQIYGDMAHRTREYLPGHEPRRGTLGDQLSHFLGSRSYAGNPTCICTGLRRKYKDAKRAYHG